MRDFVLCAKEGKAEVIYIILSRLKTYTLVAESALLLTSIFLPLASLAFGTHHSSATLLDYLSLLLECDSAKAEI